MMGTFLVILNSLIGSTMGGGGGGTIHILQVLKYWSKKHHLFFVMPKLGHEYVKSVLPNVDSFYFSSYEKDNSSPLAIILTFVNRMIRSLLIRQKTDVIICPSHTLPDVLPAIILRRKLKSKLVVYVHGFFLRTYTRGIYRYIASSAEHLSMYLFRNKADIIFAINNDIRDRLIRRGFDASKIFVVNNGVDVGLINSINVNSREYDGCFCGRLFKVKGVYDLLSIWESVVKDIPSAKLVIIGNGPEYHNIKRIVKEKKLDKNITLSGFVPEQQKFSLIKSSKLFIFPSYDETWGVAICEAMACGTPVVCYDLPCYKIFGEGILKTAIGNRQCLKNLIMELFIDKDRSLKFGEYAEKIARTLTWEGVASDELKQLTKILD
jgi:glycosyltransferase involved in cell wall biosynthesis